MEKKKKLDLAALASIPLVMTLGNSMLIPVLPTIEKKINITQFQSSLIITVYSITSIILIPIAGYLSDRFGRKKVIIPSMIITAIGGLITGLGAWMMPQPYWIILTGRLVQGFGASGAFPVVIPTVGDMYKNESDVSSGLAIIETSNTFGKVLSPILGSLLAVWIWFIPFLSIAVFSTISILLVVFLVKVPKRDETITTESPKEFVSKVMQIFRKKGKWLFGIFYNGWTMMFVLFGILFYFSSVLEDTYKINGVNRGLIISVPLLALCIASCVAGRIIGKNKVLMKILTLSGNTLAALSFFTISFFNNLWMIVFVLSFVGIGIGAALPSLDAMITEGIEKQHRGTITSIYSSMRLLGVALGPPVAAILIKGNINTIFYTLAGTNIVAVIITLSLIKPSKKAES